LLLFLERRTLQNLLISISSIHSWSFVDQASRLENAFVRWVWRRCDISWCVFVNLWCCSRIFVITSFGPCLSFCPRRQPTRNSCGPDCALSAYLYCWKHFPFSVSFSIGVLSRAIHRSIHAQDLDLVFTSQVPPPPTFLSSTECPGGNKSLHWTTMIS
jgi:hypothetical protein